MRLNVKALAFAVAVGWGGCFFFVGLANLLWPPYGDAWLELGRSIYPGYAGPGGGFGAVIVVTLYALLDGAVAGAVVAWLYNAFAGPGREGGAE